MGLSVTYNRGINSNSPTNSWSFKNQFLPDILGLSNGGFVAAYDNDSVNPGDGDFILLNFYDINASALGSYQVPYSPGTSAFGQPSLAQLANGNVLTVWEDDFASDPGLRGRLYTPDGFVIGGELKLNTAATGFDDPQVAALPGGGFAVSFEFGDDVWCGRYDNAGTLIGGFPQVNSAASAGIQNDTAVAALADGGYVVTYTDASQTIDIRTTIYNANGSVRKADFGI